MAKVAKPKLTYSLRRRFFNQIGVPLDWMDYGQGEFRGIETVQNQIKMMASAGRKVEIEFIREGKLCGYDGNESGKSIIYEKR